MTREKINGNAAILLANVIFGVNVPITADLLARWMTPMGYMSSRTFIAAVLFWAIGMFLPSERVEKKDLLLIACGGITGFILSQYLTAESLLFTSPVYFSLILALCPVVTMLLSALILKELITSKKTIGVAVGVLGALVIIMNGKSAHGVNDAQGIAFAILSITAWAFYLIIMRKISQKYGPVTQMKWLFLFTSIILLPFGVSELDKQTLFTSTFNWIGLAEVVFVVFIATVCSYFLMPYGMKYLRPTTVSVYMNLQPVVASVIAIIVGQDNFSIDKPIAAALVLVGAYIVTTSKSKEEIR